MENTNNTKNTEKVKFSTSFSTRLRETRTNRGIKMQEFSERIGVSINALSNYETGKRIPPCDVLKKMAVFLGVSADYLIGVSDESTISSSKIIDTENIIKALISITKLSDCELRTYDNPSGEVTCSIDFYSDVIRDFIKEYQNIVEFMRNPDLADYLKNGLKDTLIKKYVDKCTILGNRLVYIEDLDFLKTLTEDDLPF